MTSIAALLPHTGNSSATPGAPSRLVDRKIDMAAFDLLPYPLRRALDYHPLRMSALTTLEAWTNPVLVEQLDSFDRLQLILDDLARVGRLAA